MKKYCYLLLAMATITLSCNDAIDIEQPGRLGPDLAFQTVEDIQAGLNAVYATFDTTAEISLASNFTDEVSIGNGSGGQGFALYDFVLNAGSAAGFDFWTRNFRVNNRATILIEASKTIDVPADQLAEFNDAVAQAYFIRAYANLEMLTYFAVDPSDDSGLGLPVVDFIPEITFQPLRNTVGEHWAFINDDLQMAEDLITTQTSVFFVSADAVKALRARAALIRKDYPTAITLANELYNAYGLAQGSEYEGIFTDANNAEVIFKLDRTRNDNFDGQVNTGSVNTGGGWAGSIYTFESVNASGYFEMDRSLYNALAAADDVRLGVNVSDASSIDPNYMDDPELSFGTDQIIIAKHPGSEGQALMNDLKVFRSSEMLFIIAEAEAIFNDDFSRAAELIKELRDARANPGAPAFPLPVYNNEQEALGAILDEKRIEFCFEGHRYRDLKRIGTLANRGVSRDLTDCNRQSGACTLPADDFRFTLPIPIAEIDANPQIREQQNPGY